MPRDTERRLSWETSQSGAFFDKDHYIKLCIARKKGMAIGCCSILW